MSQVQAAPSQLLLGWTMKKPRQERVKTPENYKQECADAVEAYFSRITLGPDLMPIKPSPSARKPGECGMCGETFAGCVCECT